VGLSNKQLAFLNLRGDHKYFTIIPNILFKKGLSLPDFKLYATITKIAGPRGTCYMSTGRLAQEAGISVGAVSRSKQKLKDEGLITIVRRKRSARGHAIDHIALIDIWKENILHFVKPSPDPDKPSPGELKSSPHEPKPSPGETEEELSNKNQEEEKEEDKTDFLSQMPKPNRERIRDVLIDVLADGMIPESEFLIRPFENGVDALVLEFRKLEGKCRLDDDLTSKIIAAIRSAYEDDENWQFARVDTPTRPVIACIVAEGREGLKRAASSTEWQEASQRTQEALAERQQPERDPWWSQVLADLSLMMTKPTFETYLKDTTLLARDGTAITVGVKSQQVLEWLENRLAPIIARSLTGYGVERIQFEVVETSGGDVKPLRAREE